MSTSLHCRSNFSVTENSVDSTEHPNAMPFEMTLLYLDQPSDQPPHGAQGHRIYVPKEVAKKRLNGLIDMGVNVAPEMDSHKPQHKVGTINKAWIDGDEVKVSGLIWKKDFPDEAEELKRRKNSLGSSMELSDVLVRDANDPVWRLEDFKFTGATILQKDHAAYESTNLSAASYFVKAMAAASDANFRVTTRAKLIERAAERGARAALRRSGRTRTTDRS